MSRLPIKAVLFDLDGTLVDTAPDLAYAANLVRGELGLEPLPEADYRPAASAGARGLLKVALNLTPEHADFARYRERFLAGYRAHLSRSSRLFTGMPAVLAQIHHIGAVWGVVTNKPAWLTGPLMDQLSLSAASAVTVSGDEVAKAKPAPDALLHACTLIDVEPRHCVYVGDDLRDIVAGRAAGMRTLAADWGYLGEGGPIDRWGADAVIRTPEDLEQWLRAAT